MGEHADAIINGEDCQECGQPLLIPTGYPVSCTECGGKAKLCCNATDEEMKAAGWNDVTKEGK